MRTRSGKSYAYKKSVRKPRKKPSAKYIKRVAQSVVNNSKETKKHIVETGDETSLNVLSGGLNYLLTGISQGDTAYTRDGDEIYAMSFQGSYIITNENAFACYVRVLIISDKTGDFGVTTSELFEGVNDTDMNITDARTAGFHVPLMAKINTQKCYAIYDKVHKIDPVLSVTNMYKYNVKLNRKIVYDGSETSPAKPLHRFRLVAYAVDATNDEISGSVEFSGQCHMYFKDT